MFDDEEAFETLLRSYQAACEPQQFSNRIITRNDIYLDQAYGLLEATFTPDVLRPKRDYRRAYSQPQEPRLSVMMMRCWHVSGAHQYDAMGQLLHFNPDPLSVTTGIAAVVSGGCLNLTDVGHPSECIGTIGYLAVRPVLRRKGHGKLLLKAFEAELQALAVAQNWKLRLIVLEAEERATEFWSSCNFRWPEHSQYMQPSIQFDTHSGQPLR
jgi:GNAT superfamily N-acetyltransferase